MSDLQYNGTTLTWKSNGNKTYKATSGLDETDIDLDSKPRRGNSQLAKYQDPKKAKNGPVPEGTYRLSLFMHGVAHVVNKNRPNRPQDPSKEDESDDCEIAASDGGVELLPEKSADDDGGHKATDPNSKILGQCDGFVYYGWGWHRIRLHPLSIKFSNRDNFYLHDSKKGYSHGCVETQEQFFLDLEKFMVTHRNSHFLTLEVKYPGPDAVTNGGTAQPNAFGGDPPTPGH